MSQQCYYVDEAGKIWVDYDNQPRLEMAAFSETEFQLIGFHHQYKFFVDPDSGTSDHFIQLQDGAEYSFYRQ